MPIQPVPEVVNNIPSGDRLRRELGMSGFARIKKIKNKRLSEIIRRVRAAEHLRDFLSPLAITQLRYARKVMYPFVNELDGTYVTQKYYVQEALNAINDRIVALAEHFYARGIDAKTPQLLGINQRKAAFALENEVDEIIWGGARHPFRAIGNDYGDERATRGHYRGAVVDNWRRATTFLSLEKWGETVWNWRLEDGGGLHESPMNSIGGVRYLDETQRQGFKIAIRAGQARDAAGFFLHTGPMATVGGEGQGWGIYVMDFHGNIYVGAHEKDRFHHSSFLAGAPVAAAGEIAVDDGRIIGVTNKTGHYKAGPTELVAMLRVLARSGVALNGVAVRNRIASPSWFNGTAFVEAEGDVAALANRTVRQPPRVAA